MYGRPDPRQLVLFLALLCLAAGVCAGTARLDAVRVKQFSDEYFRLAKHHGKEFTQYVVFDEPVIVNVADRTYLIEP